MYFFFIRCMFSIYFCLSAYICRIIFGDELTYAVASSCLWTFSVCVCVCVCAFVCVCVCVPLSLFAWFSSPTIPLVSVSFSVHPPPPSHPSVPQPPTLPHHYHHHHTPLPYASLFSPFSLYRQKLLMHSFTFVFCFFVFVNLLYGIIFSSMLCIYFVCQPSFKGLYSVVS